MHTAAEEGYTSRQEMVHSVIHLFGVLLGIIGVLFLSTQTRNSFSTGFVAKLIYCCFFLITFLCSTIYHSVQEPRLKEVFKILDHISIYFLIAGTYTPFILICMNNPEGIRMLWAVWAGALVGVFFKVFFVERAQVLSVCFYLLLGFLFLFDAKNFFAAIPAGTGQLIISGAVLYVVGVIFYLWKGWKHHHAAWHVLSLAASLCHFAAVFSI